MVSHCLCWDRPRGPRVPWPFTPSLCCPGVCRREELAHRLHEEQAAERAPPAAAPTAQAAAEVAAEFGAAGEAAPRDGGGSGGTGSAGRLRRHHVPPPAGPAAAAEPAVASDMPSVPSGEHTGAATRGGAGVGAAAHGFAAAVPADVAAELPATVPLPQARVRGVRWLSFASVHMQQVATLEASDMVLPALLLLQEVEAGLGLPTSAPTAQELQAGLQMDLGGGPGGGHEHLLQQLHQQHAAADAEGQAAIEAALVGSFGNRLAPEEQAALVAQVGASTRHCMGPLLGPRLARADTCFVLLQGGLASEASGQPRQAPAKAGQAPAAVAFDNETANLAGGRKPEE